MLPYRCLLYKHVLHTSLYFYFFPIPIGGVRMNIFQCYLLVTFCHRRKGMEILRTPLNSIQNLSQPISCKKDITKSDTIKCITSDSQVNRHSPYRWSPASLTLNIYFHIIFILYLTRRIINSQTPHLRLGKKSLRN